MQMRIEWYEWSSPLDNDDESYEDRESERGEQGLAYSRAFLRALEKEFNLWTVHTNFYIDDAISQCIELTEGIETLDIISPYRARVGIGKLFDAENVQVAVRRNVQKIINRKNKKSGSYLEKLNKFFADDQEKRNES